MPEVSNRQGSNPFLPFLLAMALVGLFSWKIPAQTKKPMAQGRENSVTREILVPTVPFERWVKEPSSNNLVELLLKVPEVSLFEYDFDTASLTCVIHEENKKQPGAFLDQLRKKRPELDWLPWLPRKEWDLDPVMAKKMELIGNSFRFNKRLTNRIEYEKKEFFWEDPAYLRAMMQIIPGEKTEIHSEMVIYLAHSQNKYATRALLNLALFDLDGQVRKKARKALYYRNVKEVSAGLLEGMRHPWAPAAFHAARAMVELNNEGGREMKGLVPTLAKFLDLPDPGTPFREPGKKQYLVRELVRVNHHSNCLLCHLPSLDPKDLMRGVIPDPGKEFPDYNEDVPGRMVRANRTYLRQEFSAVLPVAHPGPWPESQRFDFLVRTRPVDGLEVLLFRETKDKESVPSEHQFAVISALRGLTGLDEGFSVEAWKRVLKKQK